MKLGLASNCYKRVLETAKLIYTNKTKEFITYHRLGSQEVCQIANSIVNKGKSAIPPMFNST